MVRQANLSNADGSTAFLRVYVSWLHRVRLNRLIPLRILHRPESNLHECFDISILNFSIESFEAFLFSFSLYIFIDISWTLRSSRTLDIARATNRLKITLLGGSVVHERLLEDIAKGEKDWSEN